MRHLLILALILPSLSLVSADDSTGSKELATPKRKLSVRPRFMYRKDFSAFDDILAEEKREKEIEDGKKEMIIPVVIDYRAISLGSLKIEDGKVAVFDGATINGGVLEKAIPNGEYSVLLAAQVRQEEPNENDEQDPPYETIVFARLELAKKSAVRWEKATFENGTKHTFGVDSGTAAFSSEKAYHAYKKHMDPDLNHDIMNRIERGLGYTSFRSWAKVKYEDAEMFRWGSFGGDGSFPCYWGFDKTGKLVALVVDFTGETVNKSGGSIVDAEKHTED